MAIQTLASAASSSRPPSPVANWSDDQLARLEFERRRLQRSFAFHPHIKVTPLDGDPPAEYEVEFRTRTLCVGDESGELEFIEPVRLRVWLPPGFPHSAPRVRPLRGLFHPNLSWEGVHLSDGGWQPGDTVAEFLRKVGELLAWRAYDPESVVNDMALQWLEANAASLPLDPSADFTPEAGGTPVERIAHNGPAALDEIARSFEAFRAALVWDAGPNASELREFAWRAARELEVFAEPDLPAALRARAAELATWARDLPASAPLWQALRELRSGAAAVAATTAALVARRDSLRARLDALAALAPATPATDLKTALAAIQPVKALDLLRLQLPAEVRELDELLQDLRIGAGKLLEEPIECPVPDDTELGRQARQAIEESAAAARRAREAAHEAAAAIEPLLERGRAETAAVARLADWREFLDLHAGGQALDARVTALGAAGVHAFFVENAAGAFGPFQLDQTVELGAVRAAVRSTGRNRVRLIEAPTIRLLGRSDTGTLVVKLPAAAAAPGEPEELATFRLTERWEDLAVRLDFLLRQTTALLDRLTAPQPQAEAAMACGSWCGQVLGVLAQPAAVARVREQHRAVAQRWLVLLRDLQALGPVKARLETWNVVQRLLDVVPPARQRLSECRAALAGCERDLAQIVSRSGRDLDTNRLVVPPALSAAFTDAVDLRRRSADQIATLEAFLKQLGAQLAGQFAGEALVGTNVVPSFEALPPFPEEMAHAIASMTDAQLAADVSELEIALNLPARGQIWKSAQSAAETRANPAGEVAQDEAEAAGADEVMVETGPDASEAAELTAQPLPES